MKLQVKLENLDFFLIECQNGIYWIRATSKHDLYGCLGKRCEQPKVEMPLVINFLLGYTLQTTRIKEIIHK